MAAPADDPGLTGNRARPLVLGGGAVPLAHYDDGSSFRDWARRAAADAIADAAIEPGDIDAVVVASESDFFSLQLAPGALLADELGLVPRPVMRVEGGGASGAMAVRAAAMQIMSGLARRVLVVGFEQTASHLRGADVQLLYALSFDADIDGMAGATSVGLYALSIHEHMARLGTTPEQMAAVSVKNHGNAGANPWAHKPMAITVGDVLASPMISTPYRLLDCSINSDGAAALVLAHPDHAPSGNRPRVRIAGAGSATDAVRLGDRPRFHRFAAKQRAAGEAYAMAGITDPAAEIGVAEVYDPFTGAEIQSLEALGLCPEGEAAAAVAAGEFGPGSRLPVNLSGGLIGQGGAPGATGVLQILTVQRLLAGTYWPDAQPKGDIRFGLADTHGGVCTISVVHVLERMD
jgi:acetyl-CoA C-acetyltransferase